MKTTQTKTTQNLIFAKGVIVLFVMLFFSGFKMLGQNTKSYVADCEIVFQTEVTPTYNTVVIIQNGITTNSNMNFLSWFMGSKQTPNSSLPNTVSNGYKRQMISSGIAPNRLLIKAFLKKASNFTNTVV